MQEKTGTQRWVPAFFHLRTVTGVLCPVLEVAAGQFWNSFPLKISKG